MNRICYWPLQLFDGILPVHGNADEHTDRGAEEVEREERIGRGLRPFQWLRRFSLRCLNVSRF